MDKSKVMTIIAVVIVVWMFLPLRVMHLPMDAKLRTDMMLYYTLIMIAAMYKLRRMPLIWNFVGSLAFCLLSMDYWELPFPWLYTMDMGRVWFVLRWRLFPVVCPLGVMFALFEYEWSFWRYIALALPGILVMTVYPFVVGTFGLHWTYEFPIIGEIISGTWRYMPNRVISTVALGWVMLNGKPSRFLRKLIELPERSVAHA